MSTFEQTRTCGDCDNQETRELDKIDAAFVKHSRWDDPCRECGSEQFSSKSLPMPRLDNEILEAWAKTPDLQLLDQDEDLILAAVENLPLLKSFVVRDDVLPEKRAMLLSALCVLISDSDPDTNTQARDGAVKFLNNNRHLFEEIGDDAIFEDIKATVYPLVGLDPPSKRLG
jgi:hypothetical protein